MRDLSTDRYTHAEVLARLHDPVARIQSRYEVLDESRNTIGKLTTVSSKPRDAVVVHNIDQAVMGSLDLKMGPDESLRDYSYRRYIKPFHAIDMPDGGWAEKPWGVYVWTMPDEDIVGRGVQEWQLVLPDQTDLLNTQGPNEWEGFTVFRDELITDAIKDILSRVGITDFSGVVDSWQAFDRTKSWLFLKPNNDPPTQSDVDSIESRLLGGASGLARELLLARLAQYAGFGVRPVTDGQVTWLKILTELHDSLAYWPPHFDFDGVYQAKTAFDPRAIVPDPALTYVSDDRSIITSVKASKDLGKFANRVVARSTNPDGLYAQVTADADEWMPGHLLAHRQTGRVVPHGDDETNVQDEASLLAKAVLLLFKLLGNYDKLQYLAHANAAHEPFDFLGVQILDDPSLGRARGGPQFEATLGIFAEEGSRIPLPTSTVPVFHQHMVSLDLNTVDMDVGGYRAFLPAEGFG